jgi:hypothetical protein
MPLQKAKHREVELPAARSGVIEAFEMPPACAGA